MTTRLMALVLLPLLTVAYAATVPFPQLRLPPAEVDAMQAHEAGSGTSGVAHFAETKAEPVTVYITGDGPTDTRYVQDAAKPARP